LLKEKFEILQPIEKLFIVKKDEIGTLIKETSLRRLSPEDLSSFIKRRSDYSSSWKFF